MRNRKNKYWCIPVVGFLILLLLGLLYKVRFVLVSGKAIYSNGIEIIENTYSYRIKGIVYKKAGLFYLLGDIDIQTSDTKHTLIRLKFNNAHPIYPVSDDLFMANGGLFYNKASEAFDNLYVFFSLKNNIIVLDSDTQEAFLLTRSTYEESSQWFQIVLDLIREKIQ